MNTKVQIPSLPSHLRHTIGLVCKNCFSIKEIDGLFVYSGCDLGWWMPPGHTSGSERANRVNGWFVGIRRHAPELEVTIVIAVCEQIVADPRLYGQHRRSVELVLRDLTARRAERLSSCTLNLHPKVIAAADKLFADGHYQEAVFAVYRSLVEEVRATSECPHLDGSSLMQHVFSPKAPILSLSDDPDEQLGYMWLFAGAVMAIRNPRAHKSASSEDASPEEALELLAFASTLFRKLEQARRNQ